MEKLENFLDFIYRNIDNKCISLNKTIKYGHRLYTIDIDLEDNKDINVFQPFKSMSIDVDIRNKCFEINGLDIENKIIVEDLDLVNKWSDKLEEIYSNNLESRVERAINDLFLNSKNKSLHREHIIESFLDDKKQDDNL